MINFIVFILVFIIASVGSSMLMVRLGYPLPKKLSSRHDWFLLMYKLILFSIFVLVQLAVLLAVGIDLFGLSEGILRPGS